MLEFKKSVLLLKSFLFISAFAYHTSLPGTQLSVSVNSEAAILMNASTGATLYEKNSRKLYYPASITKIATAAYALEVASDKLLIPISAPKEALATVTEEAKRRSNYTMPPYWLEKGGQHIGIKNGEELTLKDLLFGMLVSSGNDAANVIAFSVGGTIPHFMEQVNEYMKRLGCVDTTFYNPHGLYHPKHMTTAYEMALLTSQAMKNPIFRKIVSTTRCIRPKTNKQEASVLVQTNRLLKTGKCNYPKAVGVKTGYIAMAQNTLVAAAVQGDRMLIAVLLKCKEREEVFLDAIKLFEAAFNQPKVERVLLKSGKTDYVLVAEGAGKPVETHIPENVSIAFYPAEEPELNASLQWKPINFPIEKDQCVGEITITTAEGKFLHKIPLLAVENVDSTWTYWMKSFWK